MLEANQRVGRRLRILCAEDDHDLLIMTAEALRACGHIVNCATDGRQALTSVLADCGAFDLLITDFRMPHLDGLGLVKQSRLAGFRGRVIVFSSPLSDGDRERFDDWSVDAMVEKPSRLEKLIAAVDKLQEAGGDKIQRPYAREPRMALPGVPQQSQGEAACEALMRIWIAPSSI